MFALHLGRQHCSTGVWFGCCWLLWWKCHSTAHNHLNRENWERLKRSVCTVHGTWARTNLTWFVQHFCSTQLSDSGTFSIHNVSRVCVQNSRIIMRVVRNWQTKLFCVFGVFCPVCFVLSVPVQMTAWKGSSPKWPIMCRVGCKTLLTQSKSQRLFCFCCDWSC